MLLRLNSHEAPPAAAEEVSTQKQTTDPRTDMDLDNDREQANRARGVAGDRP